MRSLLPLRLSLFPCDSLPLGLPRKEGLSEAHGLSINKHPRRELAGAIRPAPSDATRRLFGSAHGDHLGGLGTKAQPTALSSPPHHGAPHQDSQLLALYAAPVASEDECSPHHVINKINAAQLRCKFDVVAVYEVAEAAASAVAPKALISVGTRPDEAVALGFIRRTSNEPARIRDGVRVALELIRDELRLELLPWPRYLQGHCHVVLHDAPHHPHQHNSTLRDPANETLRLVAGETNAAGCRSGASIVACSLLARFIVR
mmetsp:Transcript_38690/g.84251  ORF Transcript_38690/g.84251 Transcript_38690/m.84251 type:complete len:260 (+) Transcript_38690:722-1501(+)